MVHRAIRLDGTCTGEHGVGVGKIEYLNEELGEGTVGLMETVKRTSELYFFPQIFGPLVVSCCDCNISIVCTRFISVLIGWILILPS
jgi:hypothetical protein